MAGAKLCRPVALDAVTDVQPSIDAAYAHDGPVLIDFRVEREVNVFPIVPQGRAIGEMLVAEESLLAGDAVA